jgi:hypothetical protein
MTNYARTEVLSAALSTPFGYDWATKLFGEEVVSQLPTYSKGPRKGKVKGYVHWLKVIVGGWSREYGVCIPGLQRAWLTLNQFETRSNAVQLTLGGRIQPVDVSRRYLFGEGRARRAAERAAELAHVEALRADERREAEEELGDWLTVIHVTLPETLSQMTETQVNLMTKLADENVSRVEATLDRLSQPFTPKF